VTGHAYRVRAGGPYRFWRKTCISVQPGLAFGRDALRDFCLSSGEDASFDLKEAIWNCLMAWQPISAFYSTQHRCDAANGVVAIAERLPRLLQPAAL
jgi:hypothetical protein